MYFTHRTSADGCVAMLTANAPAMAPWGRAGEDYRHQAVVDRRAVRREGRRR
jgi:hypothetical protein